MLGLTGCKVVLGLGILGASLVSAIVVSLTAAWGLGEVSGYARTLESGPADAPWFYFVYFTLLAIGSAFALSPINNVKLNVGIQLMNAALLPIVLGFLFALASTALPNYRKSDQENFRLYKLELPIVRGWYKWVVAILFAICSVFGIVGAVFGISDAHNH